MGTLIGRGHCLTCPIRPQSLFGCLKHDELNLIKNFQTRVVTYNAGELVYAEGERLNLIYTLRQGFVKLTRFNSEGEAQIVRIVKPGDLFGYEKLVLDTNFRHTAETLGPVELCQLSVEGLKELREQSPAINQAIIERALQQVMRTEEHLTHVSLLKSKARVAWFVLDWVGDADAAAMPLSRRELGQYLGLTVETVSRHFAELKRLNLISEQQGVLALVDRGALEELSGIVQPRTNVP